MAVPGIGATAPDFNLPRDGGGRVSLAEFQGRPLVLFFYPKDDTTGCTAESLAFTALASEFEAAGAAVIGMSPDSAACHDKFIRKHRLSVALASDEEKTTLQAYGVWKEKSMYGRNFMGVERTTFLIRQDGTIATIWQKVKVQGHAETVLEAVRNLAA
ncbi:UNVERIFIED_ORG: peroxiredoxin Q/BCP [Rhizobium aethiopicum]|uniref:thioredoxin-dependent peroxiredoxin n=3 Tax=Rhizobium TaxID=379 RepID=A0A7W6W2Z2_9HYPH|nr:MULTISPECIES: peroxiredoxin [Rhizobium]MBB4233816.1 peroxiredoxin Q/BCP [Rhizobium esperanzae]OHV21936.1 peroxiredoxin [Rhizobium sp. RSm-3]RFB93865.1 peroxiredoxin [Rhizobium leguminosarum bv. trifolii]RFB94233.1 peroxiredoxin [Rhizobium leguminosarum bv. trifolii]RUM05393.1 peroxiredoxin [Rhizobium chutanense]